MPESESGWQNSHYHKGLIETYIVQKGWIGFASLTEKEELRIDIYRAGEIITTEVDRPHNIYLSTKSVIHTVKHGDCSVSNDWFAHAKLDTMTKHLSETDLLKST
jgi:hypothetical protein